MKKAKLNKTYIIMGMLAVLLILFSYINFSYSRKNAASIVQYQNTSTLEGIDIHLQAFFNERIKRMCILSNILQNKGEDIGYYIENEYKEDGKYYAVAYIDKEGYYKYRAPYNEKYINRNIKNVFNSEVLNSCFNKIIETKKPEISDIYKINNNILVISIIVPILENEEVTGFFGCTFNVEQIGEQIIYNKVAKAEGTIFGISKEGIEVFNTDKKALGTIPDKEFFGTVEDTKENYNNMLKGIPFSGEYNTALTNNKNIKNYIVSKPIFLNNDYKFSLAVATPIISMKMMYNFMLFQLMIFIIVFFMILAFLYIFIKNYNERQKLEKSLAQSETYDKLKTDFFCNMSHELRTPLTIMLNGLHFILTKYQEDLESDTELKKMFLKIRQNAFRLLKLVNNFLEISRLDSGVETIRFENIDIVKIVEDVTMSVVFYAKQKGINLIFDTQIEEKIIGIDEDGIEKVVMNLLSNAIKFTSSGGEILVNLYEEDEYIKISIKDTGIGIPEDKLNFVFQRFTQVDSSLRRIAEGTGIGLAIVKAIVEVHNGKIEVNSKEGEGSEFIISIPNNTVEGGRVTPNKIDKEMVNAINIEFSDI